MPVPTTAPMRVVFASSTVRRALRIASPAASAASRLNRSMVTVRLWSRVFSGRFLISAPMRTFSSCSGAVVIAPMPGRPARIESQISGALTPSEHSPPMPVMTMRCRCMSGLFCDQAAHGLDHVADILQGAPGLDRVHLDLDAIGFLEIEDDLGQFERMYAEFRQFRL